MPIKVMVVDDSAFMRKAISAILEKDNRLKVTVFARNGKEACEKAKTENIDVITMDVEMPEMNGLEATQKIMLENPKPIVMLSSLTHEGSKATLKALEYGAVDFIPKPSGNISLDINIIENEIINKIIAAAGAKIKREYSSFERNKTIVKEEQKEIRREPQKEIKKDENVYTKREANIRTELKSIPEILIIGTSTGGPKALQYIIPNLPKLNVPILIAQHMPAGFTAALSDSLNKKSKMEVKEGENNEELKPNVVYIAPGGKQNMTVKKSGARKILSIEDNEIYKKIYTPSVDLLVSSATEIYQDKTFAIILTGMGNDGLEGVRVLKKYRGYVIAESDSSAVVYGMPRVIAEENLADEISDLYDVPDKIKKIFKV